MGAKGTAARQESETCDVSGLELLSLLESSFLKIFVGFPPDFGHGIFVSQNLMS